MKTTTVNSKELEEWGSLNILFFHRTTEKVRKRVLKYSEEEIDNILSKVLSERIMLDIVGNWLANCIGGYNTKEKTNKLVFNTFSFKSFKDVKFKRMAVAVLLSNIKEIKEELNDAIYELKYELESRIKSSIKATKGIINLK